MPQPQHLEWPLPPVLPLWMEVVYLHYVTTATTTTCLHFCKPSQAWCNTFTTTTIATTTTTCPWMLSLHGVISPPLPQTAITTCLCVPTPIVQDNYHNHYCYNNRLPVYAKPGSVIPWPTTTIPATTYPYMRSHA